MRIWSLHPKYLDSKGLVALWREALLAQNVLRGKTKGYKNHPQLNRFKEKQSPIRAIGAYLSGVHEEAVRRGYNFDKGKIIKPASNIEKIPVTKGQLAYEVEHLRNKLKTRDPAKGDEISRIVVPEAHLLFYAIEGDIADWERV